jgi:hypothetical protein
MTQIWCGCFNARLPFLQPVEYQREIIPSTSIVDGVVLQVNQLYGAQSIYAINITNTSAYTTFRVRITYPGTCHLLINVPLFEGNQYRLHFSTPCLRCVPICLQIMAE